MRPQGAESPDRCKAAKLNPRTNATVPTVPRPHAYHRSGASVRCAHIRPSANFTPRSTATIPTAIQTARLTPVRGLRSLRSHPALG